MNDAMRLQGEFSVPAEWPATAVAFRGLALRACQAMVLLPLFWLILLPEYVQGLGDPESKSALYTAGAGPLRLIDMLLLGLVAAHGVVLASSRTLSVRFPRELRLPALGFAGAIGLSMIYGLAHGGTNLFFDWRALALGAGLYVVFSIWVRTPELAASAITLFAGFMALRVAAIFVTYAGGSGDVLLGVRIPIFDGPTLSATVFTAVMALAMSDAAPGRLPRMLWLGLSAAAYLLVLLCFRRTFWAELGIASLFLLFMAKRGRGAKLLLGATALLVVAAMAGPAFYARLQSMDFSASETEFSQGNPDHVGEVLDAWEQVKRHPLAGIGLGRSFQTLRIPDWKEESVMVHNAPLHVWLKYGLTGLACYLWFHAAMFGWLRRKRERQSGASASGVSHSWLVAALAYLPAQFVVSLGFTPWPYSSLQSATLIAFVLAVAATGVPA